MALTKYKEKRNFKESPEPAGGKPNSDQLRFVIQKHDASHLHYDFRLEMEGVLKSWAVPKGPSTDPEVKRLAMMVEDHPFDYRNFEGIIPSGYGAGTVIVWDEGFYEPADSDGKDKNTQDKELRKGIHSGKLHFILHGKKLKGEYALVKTRGQGENSWLLFKIKDKYVSKKDITLKDKSVISKKTLAQVEKTTKNFYGAKRVKESSSKRKKETALNKRADVKAASSRNRKEKEAKEKSKNTEEYSTKGKPAKFPAKLAPMLATLVDKPFDKEGWLYEIKWDGYRTIALCNKNKVELKSRNDKSFNEKFYPVYKAVQEWNINAVVDGEVVVLDENGKSNFGALQNWRSEADGDIYFYIFDLLWLKGKNLMQLPLSERREILKPMIPGNGIIRLSESFAVSGIEFFETTKKMGLEGIIAKKADSAYSPGIRSDEWLKIKASKRQEMVIGGYTINDDTSKSFSSLLLGVFEKGKLIYTGKVGTGFNDKQQKEMLKQFKPLISKTPPFTELPDINKPSRFRPNPPHAQAIWLKPELVCEVSFTEMTTDGIMRHPAFEAMRIDKKAKDVIKEKPMATKKITSPGKKKSGKILKPAGKQERKTFLNPADETQARKINGHEIKFTNLSKIYWPKEKITKRDMLNYYYQVAPYILPYLKDRPQSMNRHPNGINGESFYFKDVTGTAPGWIETFRYKSEADNRVRNYLVAKDDASLLYMATLGCIEMNPWHSRVQSEDYPDWCIIDLDPGENTFQQVIDAANVTKDILESIGVQSYPKTSGSTGIHVYIPLGAKYTYEQSKEFARIIATLVQREIPKYTSIERIVKARRGKMYIDFLQNRAQATIAAPYSLRPKPGATVSMPLQWEEVKKGLKMTDFTIYNALDRIKSAGDIFKPILGKGINLEKAVKNFNKQ
ncbi:MAG TPA: DNA ligase D [Bacteroidia bacterium]|nr:DNA ligase D [Bacteroidia bacterium]